MQGRAGKYDQFIRAGKDMAYTKITLSRYVCMYMYIYMYEFPSNFDQFGLNFHDDQIFFSPPQTVESQTAPWLSNASSTSEKVKKQNKPQSLHKKLTNSTIFDTPRIFPILDFSLFFVSCI